MKRIITLCIVGATVFGCASRKYISTDEEWARASANNSELTREEFDAGKRVYLNNCQTCHDLKDPKAYTIQQWTKIGPIMIGKVNEKDDNISLQQGELLSKYVMALAKDRPH